MTLQKKAFESLIKLRLPTMGHNIKVSFIWQYCGFFKCLRGTTPEENRDSSVIIVLPTLATTPNERRIAISIQACTIFFASVTPNIVRIVRSIYRGKSEGNLARRCTDRPSGCLPMLSTDSPPSSKYSKQPQPPGQIRQLRIGLGSRPRTKPAHGSLLVEQFNKIAVETLKEERLAKATSKS